MRPEELDKKLFELTDHELQYEKGIIPDYYSVYPTVMIDGQRVIELSDSSSKNKDSTNPESPFIVKKQTRFQSFPLHYHTWVEINYVYSGSCTQMIDGHEYKLKKGQMMLLDSDRIHTVVPLGKGDILINILVKKEYLDSEFLGRLSAESILANFFLNAITKGALHDNFLFFESDRSRRISIFMNEFMCEWFDPSPVANELLKSLFQVIITELMNLYENDSYEGNEIKKRNSIIPMLRYIEKNFRTCTLKSTAAFFGMNGNYLSNLLKQQTGQSYKSLVQQKKIKYAEQLLKNSQLPVNEIANLAGYENITFFYKKFKERYGCLPGEYRKKYGGSGKHFI